MKLWILGSLEWGAAGLSALTGEGIASGSVEHLGVVGLVSFENVVGVVVRV